MVSFHLRCMGNRCHVNLRRFNYESINLVSHFTLQLNARPVFRSPWSVIAGSVRLSGLLMQLTIAIDTFYGLAP